MQDNRDRIKRQGRASVLEWMFVGVLATLAGLVLLYVGWADEAPLCTSLGLLLLAPVSVAVACVVRIAMKMGEK